MFEFKDQVKNYMEELSMNPKLVERNLNVGFSLKNNSQSGIIYTNGKVTQLEVSNPGASVSNVSATILPTTITSGESATFTFAAKVDRSSVKNSTYYKYAITYDVNGVERYFFYTLKILA